MIKSDSDPIRQVRSDWIILIRGSNSDSKKYNLIRSDSDQIRIVKTLVTFRKDLKKNKKNLQKEKKL